MNYSLLLILFMAVEVFAICPPIGNPDYTVTCGFAGGSCCHMSEICCGAYCCPSGTFCCASGVCCSPGTICTNVNGPWECVLPSPPPCVPDCSCAATTPIGSTCSDGCSGSCAGTMCVSNGSCSAPTPTCSMTTTGVDNCGTACTRTGPACPCGVGFVCGKTYSYEYPALPLKGIVVEMHDEAGKIIGAKKTAADGSYSFAATGSRFLQVACDRTQFAHPSQKFVLAGEQADFNVAVVPAILTVTSAHKGAFVALTTLPIMGIMPPDTMAGSPISMYSSVTNQEGKTTFKIPPGFPLYITCWYLSGTTWPRTASVLIPGTPAQPQTTLSASCGD